MILSLIILTIVEKSIALKYFALFYHHVPAGDFQAFYQVRGWHVNHQDGPQTVNHRMNYLDLSLPHGPAVPAQLPSEIRCAMEDLWGAMG